MSMDQSPEFIELYTEHYETIVRYLLKRCGDTTLAYDLTSETFFKALKHFDQYQPQPDKPIVAWLYRIASNELNMYWRRRERYEFTALEAYPDLRSHEPSPEHLAIVNEDTRDITQALAKLAELDRTIVSLRFFGECSLEEICAATELKLGTVKSRLSRALKKLRKQMQPNQFSSIILAVRTTDLNS